MENENFDRAIEITPEIYWVGYHDQNTNLHCNPYLLIDKDESILFDPGSIPHFPTVMRKIIELVNLEKISTIVISHQDPDVCGNLALLEDVLDHTSLKLVAHTNTIRLINFYGLHSRFYPVDKHDFQLSLKSNRILKFLFRPYMHSPGTIVTYDPKSKSLFTGDIFGALSEKWSLFRKNDFLEPMNDWHQQYMPNHELLKNCMELFEKLEIDRILPQHGSVLVGKQVSTAINHLKRLSCGVDLT